jgi:tRNA(fMet)-specific endonuclease VapC
VSDAPPAAGVLDTSTLILLSRVSDEVLPAEPLITAITLAELSVGPLVASSEEERAARQAHV